MYCNACKKEMETSFKFCPVCGTAPVLQLQESKHISSPSQISSTNKRSKKYYLVSILSSFLGFVFFLLLALHISNPNPLVTLPWFVGMMYGLIPYFILRKDDRRLAKKCLILGIISILITIGVAIFSIAAFYSR